MVRCPSNMRAIYPPSGLAHRRISEKKSNICKTPVLVTCVPLKALRLKQCVDQVDEQSERCNAGNDVVHIGFLEPVASLGEGPAGKQKRAAGREVQDVEHSLTRRDQLPFVGEWHVPPASMSEPMAKGLKKSWKSYEDFIKIADALGGVGDQAGSTGTVKR